MKKIILSTATLLMAFAGAAHAQPKNSYLSDGSGNIVTSGFNLCWQADGDKIYSALCGDPQPAPAPKVAVVEAPLAPVVVKKAVQVNIDLNILFGFDSSKLSEKAKADLATFAKSYDLTSVALVGFTDQFGSSAYNMKLGQKRADAVKAYLVSVGVNPEVIKPVTSEGKAHPVVECKTKTIACEAPNRRVVVRGTGFAK